MGSMEIRVAICIVVFGLALLFITDPIARLAHYHLEQEE